MHASTVSPTASRDIRAAWHELKSTRKLHNRDAAEALGISEAELLASAIGAGVTRLDGDFRDLLKRVPELGTVMALTRNESCVHEKDGVYSNISAENMVGLVLGEQIDLRLFFSHWNLGYALEEETPRGTQRSFQFYDACGEAMHKIFLRPVSDIAAFQRLVEAFTSANQVPIETVLPAPGRELPRSDDKIDVAGLQAAWAGLKDTHEFFGLLKKFGVARTQALRLAGPDFARQVPNEAIRAALETAATERLEIMIFVGNRGCIQIHTGPVSNVRVMEQWVNVLDPGFNLHLRQDRVAESWVVTKPTSDGPVTSLELFDADGDTIAMLFGKRKPGKPELQTWRGLLEHLFPAR